VNAVLLESDVRRVWTAVRFIDAASSQPIDGALEVRAEGARWQRNRSGLHVLMQIGQPAARRSEFAAHEEAFDPVPSPAPLTLDARVADPLGRYLPRRFAIDLPRAALPDGPTAPRFQPLDVRLDPAPAAPLLPTWAVLRISLRHAGRPAANVALRLQAPGGGRAFGRGASDARGEALVVAAGIAQLSVGDGAVVVQREVSAELVASFDPAAPPGAVIDPDTLAQRADVLRKTVNLNLASGRTESLRIDLP
jgi:hypothetical protein